MAIYNNSSDINGIYNLSSDIQAVYHMSNIVWQKTQPAQFKITHTKQTTFSIAITCSTYNTVTINWGNGTTTLVNSGTAKTKTYAAPGTYDVTLTGDLTKITGITCNNQLVSGITLAPTATNITALDFGAGAFPALDISMCTKILSLTCTTNSTLTTLTLPTSVSTAGTRDFYLAGCTKLTSFTLPAGVTTCGAIALNGDRLLTSCILTSLVTSTSQIQVSSCPALTNFSAPNLTTAAAINLYTNINLPSIDLPELTITSSGIIANGNTKMTVINTPKLTNYGPGYYVCSCAILTTINSPLLATGVSNSQLHFYSNPKLTAVNLPNLNVYSQLRFDGNTLMTSLVLSSLTAIGSLLFNTCPALTSVSIASLTSINGNFTCNGNVKLPSVSCPSLTTVAGAFNFYGCNLLTSIYMPSLVTCQSPSVYNNPLLTSFVYGNIVSMSTLNAYKTRLANLALSQLTAVTLINLQTCGLTQAEVDAYILQCLTISNTDMSANLTINNSGTPANAAPSAAGIANAVTLRARGWTVTHV